MAKKRHYEYVHVYELRLLKYNKKKNAYTFQARGGETFRVSPEDVEKMMDLMPEHFETEEENSENTN